MAAKGYCAAGDVAAMLALDFTAAQYAQCDLLIERAEAYIDAETGRGWLVGAQSNEAHTVDSQNIYLKYAPVAIVTSIAARAGLGETETALTVDEDYEVVDLAIGHIRLVYPGDYDRVRVTYTPVATVPADLTQATIDMVAAWMIPTLTPGGFGVDSYSLPDLTVKFSRSHVQSPAPPLAAAIIERYRYKVHA